MKRAKVSNEKIVVLVNVLILYWELRGFAMGVTPDMFIYYTNLSNFAATVACLMTICGIAFNSPESSKRAIAWLKYLATCMTTVTLLVVLCILVPMQGIGMLYQGNFYCFHLICPVLMLISFLFIEESPLDRKKSYIGVLPTLIYAVIAIICNCIGVLDGPYPFLRVTHQPVYMSVIWCVVVLGIAYAVAYLLMRFHRGEYSEN